ncbi:MAG: PilZ domain-containing protein [Anaerolineales bacterium]|nr:PilZ domain-containing protein [Anaerolineales bacterium]
MLSRRKLKRRHLIYYLRLFDRSNGKLLGHLVDITTEGIKVMSEAPLPMNQHFQFEMMLPEEFNTEKITFDATSVHCSNDVNPDFYATGFTIDQIDSDHAALIETLIEEFGFRD